MKIDRFSLISDFAAFAQKGNGVVVGAPGVGKTYALAALHKKLKAQGLTPLIVPIESLGEASPDEIAQFAGHPGDFIQNLASALGSKDKRGVLMFDGFDAARGEKSRAAVLNLIDRAIRQLAGRWTVIVTVRAYDALKSRRLLSLFPDLVGGDPTKCRQFTIPELANEELAQVFTQLPGAESIFQQGTDELRKLLRVPFNLWLVERILRSADVTRFSQITSEAELLDLYWELRVRGADHSEQRQHILTAVAKRMVQDHSLSIRKDDVYTLSIDAVWSELLSDEILSPAPQSDQRIGFTHNILFDFAVSILLLDNEPASLANFLAAEPSRPLFLRPSILYHFTRLWHAQADTFWRNFWALTAKDDTALRPLTRLMIPSVVISEARIATELGPILDKLRAGDSLVGEGLTSILQALRVLGSGRRDLWAEFIESVSTHFQRIFIWDAVLCATAIVSAKETSDEAKQRCGRVARRAMQWVQAEPNLSTDDWLIRLRANIITPLVSKSYATNVEESRAVLEPILRTVGLPNFSIEAVHRLIDGLEEFISVDPNFATEIYRTVFSYDERSDEVTSFGGHVVPMSSNRRQDYDMCRYSLIQLYQKFLSAAPLVAVIAGLESVQGFVVTDHIAKHLKAGVTFAALKRPFSFRGQQSSIASDGSAMWDERFRHDQEMEIADHLFRWLDSMVGSNSMTVVESVLDVMAQRAVVAVLWSRLLKVAVDHPQRLGALLWELAAASPVLQAVDSGFAMAQFLNKAFPTFLPEQQRKVEEAIMALPQDATERRKEWLERRRDSLLSALRLEWLTSPHARDRKSTLGQVSDVLPQNPRFISQGGFVPVTEDDEFVREGINTNLPGNVKLKEAYRSLKEWAERGSDLTEIEKLLEDALTLQSLLESNSGAEVAVVAAGWNHLMTFTEKAIEDTAEEQQNRISSLRKIILSASRQEHPLPDAEMDANWTSPTWSSAPRNSAAQMLPYLTIFQRDPEVLAAVNSLAGDPVPSVRFLLFSGLWRLAKTSEDVLWPLIAGAVDAEKNKSVFQGLALSAWRLSREKTQKAVPLVQLMLKKVQEDADEAEWNAKAQLVGIVGDYAADGQLWATDQLKDWMADTLKNVSLVTVAANRLSQYVVPNATAKQLASARALLLPHLEAIAAALAQMHANPDLVPADQKQSYFRKLYGVIDQSVSRVFFALDLNPARNREEAPPLTDPAEREAYFRSALPVLEKILSFGASTSTGFLLAPTAHYFMQLLNSVLGIDPPLVLSLAARVVVFSRRFGYNLDGLAVREAVKLVETLLADYRDRIQDETSIKNLLDVLDAFTEVGWPEAVNLVWRLDEIYR